MAASTRDFRHIIFLEILISEDYLYERNLMYVVMFALGDVVSQ